MMYQGYWIDEDEHWDDRDLCASGDDAKAVAREVADFAALNNMPNGESAVFDVEQERIVYQELIRSGSVVQTWSCC